MSLRTDWEKIAEEECLHEHESICGNKFKYFDIEYVKWLERELKRLQNTSSNSDYAKCDHCGSVKNVTAYYYCDDCTE